MTFTLPDPGPVNLEFERPADRARLEQTAAALAGRGFDAQVADSAEHARQLVLDAIPEGAEVHSALSETLQTLGITAEIDESARYDSVRATLNELDRETQSRQTRKLGAAPDYIIGSAHAVTDDGQIVVGSGSGSQLGAYAYAGGNVILVIATKNSSATSTKASAAYANTASPENTHACKPSATPAASSPKH